MKLQPFNIVLGLGGLAAIAAIGVKAMTATPLYQGRAAEVTAPIYARFEEACSQAHSRKDIKRFVTPLVQERDAALDQLRTQGIATIGAEEWYCEQQGLNANGGLEYHAHRYRVGERFTGM